MSYVKRKLKHQPTDVNELSQLLLTKRHFIANGGDKKVTKVKSKKSVHFSKSAINFEVERKPTETIEPFSSKDPITSSDNDFDKISFHVGNVTYEMDDAGDWTVVVEGKDVNEEITKLRKSNLRISQENNMLRVKNELLADMIARKTLRKLQVEAEVQRLKKIFSRFSACENESN